MHQIKKRVVLSVLLAFCLVTTAIMLGACGSDDGSDDGAKTDPGDLPLLKVDDTWTLKGPMDGTEYTVVYTVVGEATVNGKGAYVVETSFVPPVSNVVDKVIAKLDRNTLFPVELHMTIKVMGSNYDVTTTYSYQMTGTPYYPMKVGNETNVVSTETTISTINGETETETETNTYIYTVERVEDITVPAGTFTCFKIVRYDETGTATETSWESRAVKRFNVKELNSETNEIKELISYSASE
ncbi:MAG: hypothetical protein WC749_15150 [Dehalococcoidia bacterium]